MTLPGIAALPSLELNDSLSDSFTRTWDHGPDGLLHHFATGIQISHRGFAGAAGPHVDRGDGEWDPEEIEIDLFDALGRGACGLVVRGRHKPTGTELAVKVVRLEQKEKREQLLKDLKALYEHRTGGLRCPFLVRCHTAYVHRESGAVHIALELMGFGSLADVKALLPVDTGTPESVLSLTTMQVIEAVKHLHLSQTLHRDIKPGNILINHEGVVKLTDFGISRDLDTTSGLCETFVGTSTYMSPERAQGAEYSYPSDIWSIGMVMIELASGEYPFPAVNSFTLLYDLLCNKPPPRLDPMRFSPYLCSFVEGCLQKNPRDRGSAIALQTHPFLLTNVASQHELVLWLKNLKPRP
mmetsp:Transcript_27905/g.72209  ORF Transcript_27905/g.72209 Transcript_27905/m.72209 type:complete len:354 (+) Transcript_27905:2-1063(+)